MRPPAGFLHNGISDCQCKLGDGGSLMPYGLNAILYTKHKFMIEKVATSAVYVTDQDKAIRFWGAQVGFEIRRDLPMGPEARWVEMAPPGADSCIVIYPKSMMEDWAERKPSLVFECEDIAVTHESVAGRGVEFSQEPKEISWGKFAIFLDSEGNWYGLREREELCPQRDK